jgi:uncharacterized protein (DUF302 family)
MILGAYRTSYAYRSLTVHLDVGLLLPRNVIVYETNDGKTFVSAINPVSALEVMRNKGLRDIADKASRELKGIIEHL